ncbi:MAG: hypothetical protein Q9227_009259 [Pyrenula ochraceoflavens]
MVMVDSTPEKIPDRSNGEVDGKRFTSSSAPDRKTPNESSATSMQHTVDSISSGRKLLLMLSLCTVIFLAALDSTIVATAAPTISRDLNAPDTGYSWIGSSYLFAQATMVPLWGKISDVFGRKPVLTIANAVFFIGSLLSGFAVNLAMFLAGRTMQGLGAGGMVLLVNISISDLFSMRDRGLYLSFDNLALVLLDQLYNEQRRLDERRVTFDFPELCRVAAKSVDRNDNDIDKILKIAEGGSYRVFEITFRDGFQVITRLPYASTRPKTRGIASEVATMKFLKLHGCPVPSVYDWSSSASNAVGVEYMIMEKVQGIELQDLWYSMSVKERMNIVGNIVDLERKLFEIPFPASGSIYFQDTKAVEDSNKIPIHTSMTQDQFCMGPSTEYLWSHQERDNTTANQGAWKSSEEVMRAVGERELTWLQKHGKAQLPYDAFYRELYNYELVAPQSHMSALTEYLSAVRHLIPDEKRFNLPTLRHPDLSPANIFVSEAGDITGVIDWQHTVVLPLFLQAQVPRHFQNFGDEESENLRRPKLPDNFEELEEDQQETQLELYRRRQLHYFYLGFTKISNSPHFDILFSPNLILRNQIYESASKPWEGDNASLKANLARAMQRWEHLHSKICAGCTECPLKYSEKESKHILELDEQQKSAAESSQRLRDIVGVNIDGWVPLESFDDVVNKAAFVRAQMLEAADTEKERKDIDQN